MTDLRDAVRYPSGYSEHWIEKGIWVDDHPFDQLALWAKETPDNPALIGAGFEISYAEFHDRVMRCASGFKAFGIGTGDAVGLQLPNVPEMLIAWHGLHRVGAIPTLLHMPYRAGELAPLMNHGGLKAVVCWTGLKNYDAPSTMLSLKKRVPSLERIFVVGGEEPAGTVSFEKLLTHSPSDFPKPPSDAPCVLAFTSGTSSAPKAVVHPFYTITSNKRIMASMCGINQEDRVLSAPPFTHIYGMCVSGMTLYAGAALVLMETFSPEALAEGITQCNSTLMFCAPAHFLGALHTGTLTPDTTKSLRGMTLAGAACPPEVFVHAEETCPNATIYQLFGMTECLPIMYSPLDASREIRMNSIGAPVEHKLRICAPDGSVLPLGEEGELEIRGPFMFAGYFGNEEANKKSFREDGWFRTGDLARIDADNNVYMSGRTKDIINRGGIKINPLDVEAMMDEHEKVFFSAIVPMPDPVLGEKACLFVQLKPGETLELDEVLSYLTEQGVAKLKWPERLETIDAMPMTPTRKIIKGELLKLLKERMDI